MDISVLRSGAIRAAILCGLFFAASAPATAFAQVNYQALIQNYNALSAQVSAQMQATSQASGGGVQMSQLFQLQLQMNQLSVFGSTLTNVIQGIQQVATNIAKSTKGGTNAMSCPVFVGESTIIGEDSCAWSQVSGQWTSYASTNSIGRTWSVGAQKEIASGWYLGGAFGLNDSWSESDNTVWSRGQSFDGSVALKHTMGPWLLAGAMFVDLGSTHRTRPAGLAGASPMLQSDANTYVGGVRLRGAYDFAFADWYVRPRLDLALAYSEMPGYQESGQSAFALAVANSSTLRSSVHPAVEIGGRYNVDASTVVRSYVILGASFLPDNTATVDASFVGPLSVLGTFRTSYGGPSVLERFTF